MRVWRHKDTAYTPRNIQPTVPYGGGSVMVWCVSLMTANWILVTIQGNWWSVHQRIQLSFHFQNVTYESLDDIYCSKFSTGCLIPPVRRRMSCCDSCCHSRCNAASNWRMFCTGGSRACIRRPSMSSKHVGVTPGTELWTADVIKWFISDVLKVKWQLYRAFWYIHKEKS
jgi:hypothetical protein